jgi:hypothetical protein
MFHWSKPAVDVLNFDRIFFYKEVAHSNHNLRSTEGNLVWGRVVADIPNYCREPIKALCD